MSIIDLYSADSWSISTALCVLSGNDETDSFSAIVRSCCWWAPGHGDCPVASSRPSDQRQKRPDDRKCWASNVVRSGDVEWLTVTTSTENVWDWCTEFNHLLLLTFPFCNSLSSVQLWLSGQGNRLLPAVTYTTYLWHQENGT